MSDPISYAECLIIAVNSPVRDSLIAKLQLEGNTIYWENRRYQCWLSQSDSGLRIGGQAVVDIDIDDALNIRSQPSLSGMVLGRLKSGTRLKLLAVSTETGTDRWWRVKYEPDLEGWVSGRFLKSVTYLKQVLLDPISTEQPDSPSMDIETAVQAWQPTSAIIAGWVNTDQSSPDFVNDIFVSEQLEITPGALINQQAQTKIEPAPIFIMTPSALLESARRAGRRNWQRRIAAVPIGSQLPDVRIGSIVSVRSGESGSGVPSNIIAFETEASSILAEINRINLPAMFIGAIKPAIDVNQQVESSSEVTYRAEVLSTFISAVVRDQTSAVRPLASYNSEQSGQEDWLGIMPHVTALATLIASRTVTPPLSIGLFGEWGAGKSFFMDRLVEEIKGISTDAHQSDRLQKGISFYKYIAQIRFNVWHYVDANLWISLVEHIFDQLRVDVVDEETAADDLRKMLLAELGVQTELEQQADERIKKVEGEITAAEALIKDANDKFNTAEQRLQELTGQNILATVMGLDGVKTEMKKLQKVRDELGLSKLPDDAENLAAAVDETRAVIDRGFKLFTPLLRAPDRRQRQTWLLIALIAPPVIGVLVSMILQIMNSSSFTQLSTLIASIGATVAAVGDWLRRQAKWVSDKLAVVESAKRGLDAGVEAERSRIQREMAVLNQQLDQLKNQRANAQADRDQATRRKAALQAEIDLLTASGRLSKFISERADKYRQQLGVMANIRQDFERLDGYIRRVNQSFDKFKDLAEEKKQEKLHLSRIVLYIDDLDRCPADKVVQVLEAIHLLLGFKCFVVVVAVDARWVASALRSRYGELLGGNTSWSANDKDSLVKAATPLDYLEKIFQIPFWLNPMNERARQTMLQGLIQISKTSTSSINSTAQDTSNAIGQANSAGNASATTTSEANHPPSALPTSPTPAAQSARIDRDLNPDSLKIEDTEFQFMNQLAPLLGRSPRALKRFVNVYRLIKISLSDEEQYSFNPAGNGEFKIVLFLLALTTNSPEISTLFFRKLDELIDEAVESKEATPQELEVLCAAIDGAAPTSLHADWLRVKSWLRLPVDHEPAEAEKFAPPLTVTIDRVAWWARRVVRYSFLMEPSALDWLDSVN